MKKITTTLLLLISLSFNAQIGNTTSSLKIPFTLTEYNNISVKAIFNDSDTVSLMFHIAVNGVSTIAESNEKLK